MKNIVFIARDARWQKYRNEIFNLLAEKYDYRFNVLTCGKVEYYIRVNQKVKYYSFKNLFPLKWKMSFFPGAIFYIIREKPQVVLALNNISQLTEYLTFLICKINRIPFIWWTHAFDHGPNRTILKSQTLRNIRVRINLFFLKKSDAVITFSENGKEYLVNNGVKESKIYSAPNTLNTHIMFENYSKLEMTSDKLAIKKAYNLPSDSKIVLFCGRLQKRKNIDLLLKAFSNFNNKNYYLLIIGNGNEKNNLQSLAKELDVRNVMFLGEIFADDKLSELFYISDIFVMPGAIGLSIVQAFSFRIPIITLDDPSHGPEFQYFEQGYNGYMLNKGDHEGIGRKIDEIFSDDELLRNLKKNAFDTAKSKCNIDETLKRMDNALSLRNP
jgi:glycosyltransferase involved in cell wall biosynthesis